MAGSPSRRRKPSALKKAAAIGIGGVSLAGIAGVINALNGNKLFLAFAAYLATFMVSPDQLFTDALTKVRIELAVIPPQVAQIAEDVETAYERATKPDWKCQVANAILVRRDSSLAAQIVPAGLYEDYENKVQFPTQCSRELVMLATMTAQAFSGMTTTAPTVSDKRLNDRAKAASAVVAANAARGVVGWVYLGRSDASGALTKSRTIAQPTARGSVTTTEELPLHSKIPTSYRDASFVTLIPAGSTVRILSTRPIAEAATSGPAGSYTWANVTLIRKPAPAALREKARRRRGTVVLAPSLRRVRQNTQRCGQAPETNSRHGATQRWIYVGQKLDGDDAFVPGTARLNVPCVPRDGQVAHLTVSSKVYVGADPGWPGVKPTGEYLLAGTVVQVSGDVSGLGFDAARDPNHCAGDPEPRRNESLGGVTRKRYCVFIPFRPL